MAYTSKFIKYYEKLGWNDFSLNFYDTIKEYLPKGKFNCLDVACGTGVLAAKIAKLKRANVSAFDLSVNMIKTAKKKSKKVNFFVADMSVFKNENQYDIIICLYDSINCLKGLNKWKNFFKNIHSSLKQKGIFIFDYNNLNAIKNWQKKYIREVNEYRVIQNGIKTKDGAALLIKIFRDNKEVIAEKFVNYMYKDEDIKKALKDIGFVIIKEYQNKLKTRNFIFCRKV